MMEEVMMSHHNNRFSDRGDSRSSEKHHHHHHHHKRHNRHHRRHHRMSEGSEEEGYNSSSSSGIVIRNNSHGNRNSPGIKCKENVAGEEGDQSALSNVVRSIMELNNDQNEIIPGSEPTEEEPNDLTIENVIFNSMPDENDIGTNSVVEIVEADGTTLGKDSIVMSGDQYAMLERQIQLNFADVEEKINRSYDSMLLIIEQRKEEMLIRANELKHEKIDKLSNLIKNENFPHGNLCFHVDQEQYESLTKMGSLKNSLSSPLCSYIQREERLAAVGEEIEIEIFTMDENESNNHNVEDKLRVEIFNESNELVDHYQTESIASSDRNTQILTFDDDCYKFNYISNEVGEFTFKVVLNHVELPSAKLKVFPKIRLKFDSSIEEARDNDRFEKRLNFSKKGRTSSQDKDWTLQDWVFKKGSMESLMNTSCGERPSCIYASHPVLPTCSWKVKVVSACAEITLSIGMATRCGIPDIDEQFVFTRHMSTEKQGKRAPINRRLSSFSTTSLVFSLYLENDTLCVIDESATQKEYLTVSESVKRNKFNLYAFVSMLHHRKSCGKPVCPRPQITLM